MGDMLSYHRGGAPPVAARAGPPTWTEPAPEPGALQPRLGVGAALGPGRWARPLRPLVWAAQQALCAITLPLMVGGTLVLVKRQPRGAGWLWLLPAYYLFFESFFIYEWRVAVPMHYPVFVLAAAGLVALVDAVRKRAR
jgi:hypothetical protein